MNCPYSQGTLIYMNIVNTNTETMTVLPLGLELKTFSLLNSNIPQNEMLRPVKCYFSK